MDKFPNGWEVVEGGMCVGGRDERGERGEREVREAREKGEKT